MARHVFYSFQYVPDNWRAAKVRNVNTLTDVENLQGNKWEEVRKSTDLAITRWINSNIKGTSCTVVLIGATTDSSRWVDYEIRHSWDKPGHGVFGIRIHNLLNRDLKTCTPGPNPFETINLNNGRKLSEYAKLYNPSGATSADVLATIRNNIAAWVETAISTK